MTNPGKQFYPFEENMIKNIKCYFFTDFSNSCKFPTMKIDFNIFIRFRLSTKIEIWCGYTYQNTFFIKCHEWKVCLRIKSLKIKYNNWSRELSFLKGSSSTTGGYLVDGLPPAYSALFGRFDLFMLDELFEVFWAGVWQRKWLKLSGPPGKNISCSSGSVISLRKFVNLSNSTKKYQLFEQKWWKQNRCVLILKEFTMKFDKKSLIQHKKMSRKVFHSWHNTENLWTWQTRMQKLFFASKKKTKNTKFQFWSEFIYLFEFLIMKIDFSISIRFSSMYSKWNLIRTDTKKWFFLTWNIMNETSALKMKIIKN